MSWRCGKSKKIKIIEEIERGDKIDSILLKFDKENRDIEINKVGGKERDLDYLIAESLKLNKRFECHALKILALEEVGGGTSQGRNIANYFLTKALILNRNTCLLLSQHEIIGSAYLVRGLIEILADLTYLIKPKNKKSLDLFVKSLIKIVEKEQEIAEKLVTKDFDKSISSINIYWDKSSISSRIKTIGSAIFYLSYDRLGYLAHSSIYCMPFLLHNHYRKEEAGRQIHDTIFCMIGILMKIADYCKLDNSFKIEIFLLLMRSGQVTNKSDGIEMKSIKNFSDKLLRAEIAKSMENQEAIW